MNDLIIHLLTKGLNVSRSEMTFFVSKGYTNEEIARFMGLTERHVKEELSQIYTHLGVESRAQLIVYCLPFLGVDRV